MAVRVLVVGINYPPEPTGIAPYTGGLAKGLRRRGHDVQVVTTYPHYPQWEVGPEWGGWTTCETDGDIPVTRLRHYVPRRPTGVRRALSEGSFGARASLRGWGRPDVVVCPSPALLATSAVVARGRLGRRGARPALGVIVQDIYSAGMIETGGGGVVATRLLTRIEEATLRSADGVCVIHDKMRDKVVSDLGVDADRVRTIRNWTHVAPPTGTDRRETRRRMGWSDDQLVVLHTGAMGEKQGLLNVVEAARAASRGAAPVRFVLMGDGGQRRMLERAGEGLATLQFVDPVAADHYSDVLVAADLLLVNQLPDLDEMALPSKLTSYFASGVAVLAATATDSSTAHEVRAAGAGVVVAPGRPEALVESVLRLAADPTALARLGALGPRHVARTLTETTALDAYAAWVDDLATGRRGAP